MSRPHEEERYKITWSDYEENLEEFSVPTLLKAVEDSLEALSRGDKIVDARQVEDMYDNDDLNSHVTKEQVVGMCKSLDKIRLDLKEYEREVERLKKRGLIARIFNL